MKHFVLLLIIVLFTPIQSKSTNISLDSIKLSLIAFLNEIEPWEKHQIEDIPNFLIIDRKNGQIEEKKEGIFIFSSSVSSGNRAHFLLIERKSFQVLNMKDSIEHNILKLTEFLARNKQYSKNDILFYINLLVETHLINEKHINSFNGIIR